MVEVYTVNVYDSSGSRIKHIGCYDDLSKAIKAKERWESKSIKQNGWSHYFPKTHKWLNWDLDGQGKYYRYNLGSFLDKSNDSMVPKHMYFTRHEDVYVERLYVK